MKTLKWTLLVVLVTGVGVSTVMLRTRSPRPLDLDANEPNQAVERNEAVVYQPAPLATVPVLTLAPSVPLTINSGQIPAEACHDDVSVACQPAVEEESTMVMLSPADRSAALA